jgi:hypothetical protein
MESFVFASPQLRTTAINKGWKQKLSKLLVSSDTTILSDNFLSIMMGVSNLTKLMKLKI